MGFFKLILISLRIPFYGISKNNRKKEQALSLYGQMPVPF